MLNVFCDSIAHVLPTLFWGYSGNYFLRSHMVAFRCLVGSCSNLSRIDPLREHSLPLKYDSPFKTKKGTQDVSINALNPLYLLYLYCSV